MADGQRAPSVTLVERDDLLDEIAARQRAVATTGGCVVWISGEAGSGKTTLANAAVAQTRHRVLTGACDAMSTPRPLGPLLDFAAQAPHLGAALARRVGRHELFEAMLTELSTPTLVIVEDVHWADEGTIDLLRFLVRRVSRTKAVVLVTYRSDDVAGNEALRVALGDLAAAPGSRRMAIRPLSVDGVRALACGHALDPVRLHEVTGGNPFYVTEVLSTEGWAVPATVADAVLARASRLPPEAVGALDVVSIEPGGMEWWLADHLGVTAESLGRAVDSGMLIEIGDAVAFRHELARLAIYERVRGDRLATHHAVALAALVGRPERDPSRLAHHAERAGDLPALVEWASLAGARAADAGAHREATAHYERASRAAGAIGANVGVRCPVLTALATQLTLGDRQVEALSVRREALDLWRRHGGLADIAVARAEVGAALWRTGRGEEAYRTVAVAIDEIERLPITAVTMPQRAAVLTIGANLEMLARQRAAIALADRAIAAAHESGEWMSEAQALNARGSARIVLAGDLDGVDDLERARSLGTDHGSDRVVSHALENLGSGLGEVRRFGLAASALEASVAFSSSRDLDTSRRYSQAWLARVRFEQGRWADAEDLLDPDLDACLHAAIVAATVTGLLRARCGQPGADEPLERAWALALDTGDLQRLWPVVAARAEAAWLAGRLDDALVGDLGSTADQAAPSGMPFATGELGYWSWKLGIASGPLPDGAAEGYARHVAGDLAGAARWWAELGAPYEAAMALADSSDESMLREALDRFIALGAAPMAQRVRRLLRERGARGVRRGPKASTASGRAGLTPRQRDVLALVADGLTNPEIGVRLHLSARTVGHHVAAILRTLGVSTRTQAAVSYTEKMGHLTDSPT